MESYSIYFRFRGKEKSGHVHQYDSFYFVYFSDQEMIQEFGGQIRFDINKKPSEPKQVPDALTLYKAIADQLR